MTLDPKITVFMAVFNGSAFLKEAIESVLNQTFENFELLIINDGSVDNSLEIINSFEDRRIRVLDNLENKGLIYTRNRGINEARGKYIAVLDCDDIAIKDRLQIQYDYLERNPDTALCGGHVILIDEEGKDKDIFYVPVADSDMSMLMLFRNTIVNSTAMIQVNVMKEVGGYMNYTVAEDFDLFLRIAERYNISNIDHILSKYRINANGISTIKRQDILDAEKKIIKEMLERLNIEPDNILIDIHHALYGYQLDRFNLSEFKYLLEKLKLANKSLKKYNEHLFNTFLYNKWYDILRAKKEKSALYHYFNTTLLYKPAVKFKHLRKIFKQSLGII